MAGGMALAHHALQSLRVVQIGVEQAAFDIARGLFDGVARAGSLLGDVLIALVRQARAMDERLDLVLGLTERRLHAFARGGRGCGGGPGAGDWRIRSTLCGRVIARERTADPAA